MPKDSKISLPLDEIASLMESMGEHEITTLFLKNETLELKLDKASPRVFVSEKSPATSLAPVAEETMLSPQGSNAPNEADSGNWVSSPMVGTYYQSSGPDEPPFVKVGDRVKKDTVVCIIEAMKVMNEVKAGIDGVVRQIAVEDGQPVEFASKILLVEP